MPKSIEVYTGATILTCVTPSLHLGVTHVGGDHGYFIGCVYMEYQILLSVCSVQTSDKVSVCIYVHRNMHTSCITNSA